MSRQLPSRRPGRAETGAQAQIFAALGDPTRLAMVARLCRQGPLSIVQLAAGFDVTRQAVTKHLRVLADAGLVRGHRRGRGSSWALETRPLEVARRYLDMISARWDGTLERLRDAVER